MGKLLEKQGQTHFPMVPLYMDVLVLADQQEFIFISSVQRQDVVQKNYKGWWMIGKDGKRLSGKSVVSMWLDDDYFLWKKLVRKWKVNNCFIQLFLIGHHKPTNNKSRPNQTFQNQNTPITFQDNFLNNFPDHHHIYKDGSKQRMKVGCAAVFQNQELLKHLPNKSSISSAEAISINLAMNIIANHKSSKFIIYSDSKSVLQALQSEYSSTPLITRLLDKMNTLSKNNSIILTWIPSHIGIQRNERADKAAKKKHSRHIYSIQKFLTPT